MWGCTGASGIHTSLFRAVIVSVDCECRGGEGLALAVLPRPSWQQQSMKLYIDHIHAIFFKEVILRLQSESHPFKCAGWTTVGIEKAGGWLVSVDNKKG